MIATVRQNLIKLNFNYDPSLIADIKRIPGRKYWSTEGEKYWTVPFTRDNILSVKELGFAGLEDYPKDEGFVKEVNIDLTGLKLKLRKYQEDDVKRIVGKWDTRALIGSEVGTGKTAVAIASLYATQGSLPALVVCPASLKLNWRKEVMMWLPDNTYTVRVLEGYPVSSYYTPKSNEITVVNYDIMADRSTGNRGWGNIFNLEKYNTLILDECHKIKNMKSARSKIITKIAKKFKYALCLSGTPIESKPIEFYPVLKLLKSALFPSFWKYAQDYCNAQFTPFGWDLNGASNIPYLFKLLTQHIMVRHLKSEILTELPPLQRIVTPVSINMDRYFKEMYIIEKEYSANKRSKEDSGVVAMAMLERLRQVVIDEKMSIVFNWIDDYLETGKKLIVFCIHKAVVDALKERYAKSCVVVDGRVTGRNRQAAVDAFQGDPNVRLFIGNIKAAGEGITLTQAQDCLFIELDWTASAHQQAENRHHRIGQTADRVCAYYLVAEGTVEDYVMDLIDNKASQFSKIIDGADVNPGKLLSKLLEAYKTSKEG